jgi:hypothetical protein
LCKELGFFCSTRFKELISWQLSQKPMEPIEVRPIFPGSKPTVKQRLAAVRMLFDFLVVRQITPSNPAHSVRGPTMFASPHENGRAGNGEEWGIFRHFFPNVPQSFH